MLDIRGMLDEDPPRGVVGLPDGRGRDWLARPYPDWDPVLEPGCCEGGMVNMA